MSIATAQKTISRTVIPKQVAAPAEEVLPQATPEQTLSSGESAVIPSEQAIPEGLPDAQSSMPMPPTPQGPELEPEKEIKPVEPEVKPKAPEVKTDSTWDMPETGKVINGRYYTKHALERMAPDTPQVRAELLERVLREAAEKDIKPCTLEFEELFKKIMQPRNIPPSVVEDVVQSTISPTIGRTVDTLVYEKGCVRVVLNRIEDVITVFRM